MSSISYAFAGTTGCFQQPNGQWHCINGKLIGIGNTRAIALQRLSAQLNPVHHNNNKTNNSITLPKKTIVPHHHHLILHHHHTDTHPHNFVSTHQNTTIKSNGPIKNKGNNFLVTKNVNGKTTVETNHPENLHIKSNHPVTVIKKSPPPPDTSATDFFNNIGKGLTDAANSTGKFIGDTLGLSQPTNPTSPLPTKRHHFHHQRHPQTTPFTEPSNDPHSTVDRQPIHGPGKTGDTAPTTPNQLAVQRALDNQGGITDLGAPDTTTVDPSIPSTSSPVSSDDNSTISSSPPPQDLSADSASNTAPPGTSPSDSGNSSVIILGGLLLLGLIVVLI